MKLLSLTTGKEVAVGDKLRAVSGTIVGHLIEVKEIVEPCELHMGGLIRHNMSEGGGVKGWQQLVPRVLDCIFIEDDSLVTSATYDNEKSVGKTIQDILIKMRGDGRDVRKILLGEKEWDKIRDLDTDIYKQPELGKPIPPPKFYGVLVVRIPHREQCLAFEHGAMEQKTHQEETGE